MRFLSLRLKPKAAPTPRMGRGPGTDAGLALALTWTEMVSPEPSSVHVPRVPEVVIPKDASDIPLKVELLKMEVPEAYVGSIVKTLEPYMRAELMPLSLDDERLVGVMPAPRVVGPVMEYMSYWVVVAVVPLRNAKSSCNTPFESPKLPELSGEDGKFNDPVPSITRSLPDS